MPEVLRMADIALIYDNTGDYPQMLMMYGDGDKIDIQLGEHISVSVGKVVLTHNTLPTWFVAKYYEKIIKVFNWDLEDDMND